MAGQLDPQKQAQYNRELEKTKQIQGEQVKSVEDLKQSLQDVLFLTRDYASEARSATKSVFENTVQASAAAKAFKDLSGSSRDITREYGEIAKGSKKISDIGKDLSKLEKNKLSLQVEQQQALSKILTTTRFGAEAQDDINSAMNTTAGLQDVMLKYANDLSDEEQYLLDLYNQQNVALDQQESELKQVAKQSKNIGDATNMFGDSAVGLQDIGKGLDGVLKQFGLGGISDKLGLEEASKSTRKLGARLTKNGTQAATISDKFQSAGHYTGQIGKSLSKSLGPAAALSVIAGQFAKAFQLIDSASGEMAKNYAISNVEAQKLVGNNNRIATTSGNTALNTKNIGEAQASLNAEFGTSTVFSDKLSSDFALIQKRLGLSAETMGRLTVLSMANDGNMMDQLETIQGVTLELNNQEGISLNQRDIQEGLSQLSASQLIANKMNTKELTNQVFQAKLLGVSQSQLEGISSNLLDFSSSIEAEMQAELLTGKELNLERARAAALTGDHATLAQELRREMAGLTDEQKQNPIILGQFATALGMSREELSKSIVEQQKLNFLTTHGLESMSDAQEKYNKAVREGNLDEIKRLETIKEGVGNQLKSANMQERLNDVMAKFTDMFVNIAEKMMPMLEGLASIVESLIPYMGMIAGGLLGGMAGGPLGALAGMGAGLAYDFKRNNEITPTGDLSIDPNGGPIVMSPREGGIFQGSRNDGVSMSPSHGASGGGNNGEVVSLLKELIGAVKQGGDVYIDGAKAGRSLALSTSRMG